MENSRLQWLCLRQEIITIVTYWLSSCLNILIILYLLLSSLLRSGLLEILNLDSFFANSFPLYRRHRWESQSLISVPLVWTGTVCFTLLTDTVLALAVFLKLGALSMVFLAGSYIYSIDVTYILFFDILAITKHHICASEYNMKPLD